MFRVMQNSTLKLKIQWMNSSMNIFKFRLLIFVMIYLKEIKVMSRNVSDPFFKNTAMHTLCLNVSDRQRDPYGHTCVHVT
jgi:hypothetical protein